MLAVKSDARALELRFRSGGIFTLFAWFFALLGLALLGVGLTLPSTATLTCDRASGRCVIDERAVVRASSDEFAVTDLRGAHVATSDAGSAYVVVDTATGARDLGMPFHGDDATRLATERAAQIAKYAAAPEGTLAVTAMMRRIDARYWALTIAALLFSLVSFAWRARGQLLIVRDVGKVTWTRRNLFGRTAREWPLGQVSSAEAVVDGFYSIALLLRTSDGGQVILRQWRSKSVQRAVQAAAREVATYLGAAA